jgi:serine/threonine-protein kinase
MSLAPGARLGPYEVIALIGRGGMGEVYRAREARLERDVAIKLLPDVFRTDPDRLARFAHEARVLAGLNHPHIAVVHGLEDTDGSHALVMELVEGPTLDERLRDGPLDVDEALTIARQIADALDAAHAQGIVHRDLKPANVKVRPDGSVKVLDFGLSKTLAPSTVPHELTQSPTLMSPAATQQGVILGTAAYMAPEQAKGRAVDTRVDVWGFGCVLYEMLTGRRAFEGGDVTEVLASVIKSEPDWGAVPSGVPPMVQVILRRCLEKDPKRRVRDIGDVRLALDGAFDLPTGAGPGPARQGGAWLVVGAALAGAMVAIAGVATFTAWTRSQPAISAGPVSRFALTLAEDGVFSPNALEPLAITPDGRRIVFTATGRTPGELGGWLLMRALDQFESVPLPGFEGRIGSIFLSPDGASVGFNRGTGESAFRRIPITGGMSSLITSLVLNNYQGATWGARDDIVFTVEGLSGLQMVPAGGGTPVALTTVAAGERHVHPHFLPDGRRLLYVRRRTGEPDRIVLLDVETGESRDLIEGAWPRYAPSGHLVFARGETIWAAAVDVRSVTVLGEERPVLEGVNILSTMPRLAFSGDGTLVYIPAGPGNDVMLAWVEREGAAQRLPLGPDSYWLPRLSPDGRRLAVGIDADLWVIDLERGGRTRLTAGETSARFPFTWTPDGTHITFASTMGNGLFRVRADGTGRPELLLKGSQPQWPTAWSPDGRTLAFYVNATDTARDLWTLDSGASTGPRLFLSTAFQERAARFAPNGRWLAYASNESGRDEVYVRPYPGPGASVAISSGGGTEPLWSPSGRELFYRNGAAMLSVEILSESPFRAGPPTELFVNDALLLEQGGVGGNALYDVHPDGRFLMVLGSPLPTTVHVVLNWFEELKRLVPVNGE